MIGFLSNVWDFIWMFFTIFVFFAWLMALFSIIGDLFRDRALSGWAKAIWLIALIFVPFLTAVVYLIARGGNWEYALAQARSLRMAHNQVMCAAETPIAEGDEVAFFPPVTGG